jgi:hypothetical protein
MRIGLPLMPDWSLIRGISMDEEMARFSGWRGNVPVGIVVTDWKLAGERHLSGLRLDLVEGDEKDEEEDQAYEGFGEEAEDVQDGVEVVANAEGEVEEEEVAGREEEG